MAENIPEQEDRWELRGLFGTEELWFSSVLCSVPAVCVSAVPWRWQGRSCPRRIYWQGKAVLFNILPFVPVGRHA